MGQITDTLDSAILTIVQQALDELITFKEATQRVKQAQAIAEEERKNEQHHTEYSDRQT